MDLRGAAVHTASCAEGSETAGEPPPHSSLSVTPVTEGEFIFYLQTPHIIILPANPPGTWD